MRARINEIAIAFRLAIAAFDLERTASLRDCAIFIQFEVMSSVNNILCTIRIDMLCLITQLIGY